MFVSTSLDHSKYDVYPTFFCGANKIFNGYDSLSDEMFAFKNVVVDGFVGVNFDVIRQEIDARLRGKSNKQRVLWHEISSVLKQQNQIDALMSPCVNNNDPLFGKRCMLELQDFFDMEQINLFLQSAASSSTDACLNIWLGIGSSLLLPLMEK